MLSVRAVRRRLTIAATLIGLVIVGSGVGWWARRDPAAAKPAATPTRSRWVVVGIDGGDWKVIRRLWAAGALPNLRRLAERGTTATLGTAYNRSPVIWTTIATGVTPEVHGISDFVVPTAGGDVPISSTVRRVPALWNMLSRAGRRVAVLGWWGTWPAESIRGVVVSDRVLIESRSRVSPEEYGSRLAEDLAAARREPGLFGESEPERRDALVARSARRLVREPFDLVLCYLRSVDTISHLHWRSFEPERFGDRTAEESPTASGDVPRIYAAVDAELGAIERAAGPATNVLVISDHGFHAAIPEDVRVDFDLDAVLAAAGFLERQGERIDLPRSIAYTYSSPSWRRVKMVRLSLRGRELAGRLATDEAGVWRRRLAEALAEVRNERGESVLTVRDPVRRRGEDGDLVVIVSRRTVSADLYYRGQPLAGVVKGVSRISGTHSASTPGILLAAGPDLERGARLEAIHIRDIAPTLLYGLGLPVADDFAGRAYQELFTAEFRAAHPLRRIATWGKRAEAAKPTPSASDQQQLDELRALGYLP